MGIELQDLKVGETYVSDMGARYTVMAHCDITGAEGMLPVVAVKRVDKTCISVGWLTSEDVSRLSLRTIHVTDGANVDDLFYVRDSNNEKWRPRYFAGWCEGKPMAWTLGRTSLTAPRKYDVNPWHQWRKPTEDEMKRNA